MVTSSKPQRHVQPWYLKIMFWKKNCANYLISGCKPRFVLTGDVKTWKNDYHAIHLFFDCAIVITSSQRLFLLLVSVSYVKYKTISLCNILIPRWINMFIVPSKDTCIQIQLATLCAALNHGHAYRTPVYHCTRRYMCRCHTCSCTCIFVE